MATQVHACGNCEKKNLPSVCVACVNRLLQEKYNLVNALKQKRDSLYKRLDEELKAKREAVEQRHWLQTHGERIAHLKQTLCLKKKQVHEKKSELQKKTDDYNSIKSLQDEAYASLEMNIEKHLKSQPDRNFIQISYLKDIEAKLRQNQSVILKQLCMVFPLRRVRKPKPNEGKSKDKKSSSVQYYDQICDVPLPIGLDPSSVTPLELAVSLGYMLQLLNLAARYLNAPLLLNSGFAGSSSRVWQRASYWNSRPAASKYYRLFIPGQNFSASPYKENGSKHPSKSESSSSPDLESKDQVLADVTEGIYLLKRAVACVTDYCCNSLGLLIPTELSTFDRFAKLLTFLASKDEVTASNMSSKDLKGSHSSIVSSKDLKGSHSRNRSQAQQNPMTSTFIHHIEIPKQKRAEGSGGIAEQKRAEESGGIAEQKRAEESSRSNIVGNTTLPLHPSDEDVKEWLKVIMAEAKKKIDYHRSLE